MLSLLLAAATLAAAPAVSFEATSELLSSGSVQQRVDPAKKIYVVVEGMRGQAAPEVAAKLVADTFAAKAGPGKLAEAAAAASAKVFAEAGKKAELKGMGALLVGAAVSGDRLHIAHVGDCRAWRLRAGKLEQLTADHTLLNDYLKTRKLTPEEIKAFPYKHVVVRAVGMKATVEAEVREEALQPGDRYLLASAELQVALEVDAIAKALGAPQPAKALRDAAAAIGVKDLGLMVLAVGGGK